MDNFTKQVADFHHAFELHDQSSREPRTPPPEVGLLRVQCLIEEVGELAHAMGKKDKVEILDALVDIQYFLSGTVLACGMQYVFEAAFEEVHRTNMAKLGPDGKPIRDASGRVVKPKGWKPPELEFFAEGW